MIKQLKFLYLSPVILVSCTTVTPPPHQAGLPQDLPAEWRHGGKLGTAAKTEHFLPVFSDSPYANNAEPTSLWSSSPQSLFGDRRASQAGDILTVVVEIDDEAEMQNSIDQSQQSDQDFSVGAFFGLPQFLDQALPNGASMSPAVAMNRGNSNSGAGNIRRGEKITLRLAAQVTGLMPNGYLAVAGQQEIMINNEGRYLKVTGLVRPEDISRLNTVTYDKIANARIFYGGQGSLSDTVRPKAGQRVINKLLPF